MKKSMNWWSRKLHRIGAIVTAIPLLIVIASGLLLQVKKQVPWVQPPTQKGATQSLDLSWDTILAISQKDPFAGVQSWSDINRLDVRPNKGVIKIRCQNGWELQIDSHNGNILSSSYRRSDWIESLHDGSFFSDFAKLWLFFPNGIVLLSLWISGLYLWYLPIKAKSKKKKRIAQSNSNNK